MDDNVRSVIIGISLLIVGIVCLALFFANISTESFQYLGIFGGVATILGLLITIPSVKSIKRV
jgi:membrane-bound ClpP family serine protease